MLLNSNWRNLRLDSLMNSRSTLWRSAGFQLCIGVLCILGFEVFSSVRDVKLEQQFKSENPYDYLLVVFGLAALFYLLLDLLSDTRKSLSNRDLLNLAWLNVSTAGNWVGLFLALKYLSPPVISVLFAGGIPGATLVVNRILRSDSSLSSADMIATGLLIVCSATWAIANINTLTGSGAANGLFYIAVSSFTIASTTVFSKSLADNAVKTSTIMGQRFYLLIAMSLIMSSPIAEIASLVERDFEVIIFVVTVGTIASLWLLQKGIEKCEPVLTEVVIATSPVITLLVYAALVGYKSVAWDTAILSIAVVVIAVFHVFFQYKQTSKVI
jgi:drug/metabolite transporter (DMT)-like permease